MPYDSHYQLADDVIAHLNTVVHGISDPFISSRYVGLVAVVAVTVYELAVKEIFIQFGSSKHKLLGNFTEIYFERINGRIKITDLQDNYIHKFGEKYVTRFRKKLDEIERRSLKEHGLSVRSRYGNIIACRHDFAHEGKINANNTYDEIVQCYISGKEVIRCLAETMNR